MVGEFTSVVRVPGEARTGGPTVPASITSVLVIGRYAGPVALNPVKCSMVS